MRVIVFDLDNTLCAVGMPVLPGNVAKLKALAEGGNRIVICSGKPYFYQCGFLRQLGIADAIMVGENGGVIANGCGLPPEVYYKTPLTAGETATLAELHDAIENALGDRVFFQPNQVGLTAFPYAPEAFDEIAKIIVARNLSGFVVYRHSDSFDITPERITKFEGLKKTAELFDLPRSAFVGVGDNQNDYPMFDFCPLSIGVGIKDKTRADLCFDTIDQALDYLLSLS